ncbi:helix-turn-helix transcriptional regulator [Cohnella cholangitidis]|uniref:Helix-turn-helix transcriptional regulator n=1 Tax=Cohnella cholangitidis TaxID=2598458 RepID=A0A7G5C5F3_9BACL|nr:helix-turn-helix transcriptional regulator [Cohnella cholangitidis]QMV44437.1 helix-turn-helix transcriptional regulator [Cohnella cholangitidis]
MAYSLGAKIRELRGALSQEELAEKINKAYGTTINKGMISKWENNLTDPSLDTARVLVLFFNITLDELLGLDQKEPEPDVKDIAAHHDGESWTEEELEVIRKFKELIKSQRPKE